LNVDFVNHAALVAEVEENGQPTIVGGEPRDRNRERDLCQRDSAISPMKRRHKGGKNAAGARVQAEFLFKYLEGPVS
jgi:hypothetical protein